MQNNALTHFATGGAREREQCVYTPQHIIDLILAVWPEGIVLDPCSGPDSIVPALYKLEGRRVWTGRVRKDGSKLMQWEGEGLLSPWPQRTYINPPYGDLQKWVAHKRTTVRKPEEFWLVPNRTRSAWFRKWRDSLTARVELDRVCFNGFKGSFPESLILGYVGERADMLEEAVAKCECGSFYSH